MPLKHFEVSEKKELNYKVNGLKDERCKRNKHELNAVWEAKSHNHFDKANGVAALLVEWIEHVGDLWYAWVVSVFIKILVVSSYAFMYAG